jgi:hypothetical protein
MEPSNYVPNVRRRQWTPLYDTITLAAAGTLGPLTQFFGRTAAGSGIAITNMQQANMLPGVEAFEVHALRVFVLGVTADLEDMYQNLVVRFYRGRAVELEAPVEYFAGGAGMYLTTAASVDVYNGIPDPRAIVTLPDPIRIEGGEHFSVTLEGVLTTASARLTTRIYLDGAYDKGVQ